MVEHSDVQVSTLPDYLQQRVRATIRATSLSSARDQVSALAQAVPTPEPSVSPTPTPSATPSPGTTSPDATLTATPLPAPVPTVVGP